MIWFKFSTSFIWNSNQFNNMGANECKAIYCMNLNTKSTKMYKVKTKQTDKEVKKNNKIFNSLKEYVQIQMYLYYIPYTQSNIWIWIVELHIRFDKLKYCLFFSSHMCIIIINTILHVAYVSFLFLFILFCITNALSINIPHIIYLYLPTMFQ